MEVRDGRGRMINRDWLRHGLIKLWHGLPTVPLRTVICRTPCRWLCTCLLFSVAASLAQSETVTVRKLSGQSEEGELSGLSATEITLRAQAGNARIPVQDALDV